MGELIKGLAVLMLLSCSSVALAGNQVLGTVELELETGAETWYVLRPEGDMLPSAVWIATGPDKAMLSLAAYQDPDIELVKEPQTGSAIPAGKAPVLVLAIGFPLGADAQQYQWPAQSRQVASVMLLADWSQPLAALSITEDPGEIQLTEIDARRNGESSFAGVFSGVLRRDEQTKVVRNATFKVSGVPFFDRANPAN